MSIPFTIPIPFIDLLGFTLERMDNGESELHFTPRPEHMNSFEVAHGGVSMTLLDVAMAVAARSVDPDMGVVTIEMKTTFMQPATGPLIAKGRLIQRTSTMAFVEATITNARRRTCSHATGTFKYVKRLPPSPAAPDVPPPLSTD